MTLEDRLAETLRSRADLVAGRPVALDAVQETATTIRRHRTRVLRSATALSVTVLLLVGGALLWGPPIPPPGPADPLGTPVATTEELAGVWQVVAVDGRPAPESWASSDAPMRVDIQLGPGDPAIPERGGGWRLEAAGICLGVAAALEVADGEVRATQVPEMLADCVSGDQLGVEVIAGVVRADTVRYTGEGTTRVVLLAGDQVVLELVRVPDVPVRDGAQLAGEWKVEAIDGAPATRGTADLDWPVMITFVYDEDAVGPAGEPVPPLSFSARFDCNTSGGSVEVREGSFSAEVVTVTQALCGDAADYRGTEVGERLMRADGARFAHGEETLLELLEGDEVVLALRLLRRPAS